MDETFMLRIRDKVLSQPRSIPFPPASEKDIEEVEAGLGFSIPTLLKATLLMVGNGGFGPGRGGSIIGTGGGYASDFGTLVETYKQLKQDHEAMGGQWQVGLLPFCEWGCNIFSCVDCNERHHPIYMLEESVVFPRNYTLHEFFNLWIDDADVLSYEKTAIDSTQIVNPFTGQEVRVTKRKRS